MIVTGEKIVENRSRTTRLRGPLLIHAAATQSRTCFKQLDPKEWPKTAFGALVGIVDLIDILDVDYLRDSGSESASIIRRAAWEKWRTSPHVEGPKCWLLDNARQFVEPIPYKGWQGLFEVQDSVIAGAKMIQRKE
jgi:hypothetical protein